MRMTEFGAGLAGVLLGVMAQGAPPVSLESLLDEMIDRTAVARYPDPPYVCTQFSSYDRASTTPTDPETWFANGDANQYLRVEENGGRMEWVMVDAPGPGAVVRIWSANPKGTMRVYIDNGPEPVIEAPMTDVLGGKWMVGAPFSQESSRGWNLYLPIPYAEHCKVTSDSDGFYYQVNVRTYPNGTAVESFAPKTLEALTRNRTVPSVAHIISGLDPKPNLVLDAPRTLAPNESMSIDAPDGPGEIDQIKVRVEGADRDQALRSTVLSMEFDGEQTVWCPIGDFFGSGIGVNSYKDVYRRIQPDGTMIALWLMPYQRSARVTLTNLGSQPVAVAYKQNAGPWEWDDNSMHNSMHFHAVWRQEHPIHAKGGRGTEDWNYVEVTGKGLFVGDNLNVVNPVEAWWGEGDEKIYVDGEAFPSHFGTGTEDYYGYAWCSPQVFEHPYHAQPRCDGGKLGNNWGYTSVTRVRALDAIPFTTSFRFDMEVWHWAECDVAYAATSCFYAMPGAVTNVRPDPEGAAAAIVVPTPLPPPFKVEGAIECEGMKVLAASEGVPVGPQGGFGPKLWSGGEQLWVRGRGPGDFVELEIAVRGDAARVLHVYATRSWDYGIVRFSVNGKAAGKDVDLFNEASREVVNTGPIELGKFYPEDGRFVLRAEVVGGNPRSEGARSFFGLDCVTVEQLPLE